jgi:hypothetical protein
VDYSLTPAKPDKQFKRAQELKAAFTAKLENHSAVRVRNLKTREEQSMAPAQAVEWMRLRQPV